MRVTAILAIRNEEKYLHNCLRYLGRNDIDFVVIDNESSDLSQEIYRSSEFSAHLVDVQYLPFRGSFSLREQLERKTEIIAELDTDWVIHHDADEVFHSYRDGESLKEAIIRIDADGWNAINFDEFCFLPIEDNYETNIDTEQNILHYYFMEPHVPRGMRAWRKAHDFSMLASGGHILEGDDMRMSPETMAWRHYLVRSQAHAFEKYAQRTFADDELALGWHRARANKPADVFKFPDRDRLKKLAWGGSRHFDKSDPWRRNYWMPEPPTEPDARPDGLEDAPDAG